MYSDTAINYSGSDNTILLAIIYFISAVLFILIVWYFWRVLRLRHQLKMTKKWIMYKVSIPKERHAEEDDQRKDFREMLSVVEPFYANLNSLFQDGLFKNIFGHTHVSLEIIAKKGLINFYVGCPIEISDLILRNLQAQYPAAEVHPDLDYSIFPEKKLKIAVARLSLLKKYIFPIKTYRNLEEDPLNAITNSLSRLRDDETAGIQLLVRPTAAAWRSNSERAVRNISEGKRYSYSNSKMVRASETFFSFVQDVGKSANKSDTPEFQNKVTPIQENQIKMLGEKSSKLGLECQLRIIAVSETKETAKQIVQNIASTYNQFNSPESNSFRIIHPRNASELIACYIFRVFGNEINFILNTEELASIFHMPNRYIDTPNLSWLLAKKEPPPANLPADGTIIGKSVYRGQEKEIRIKLADRLRHVYQIGKTGVGKTVMFQNMIRQDIEAGHGVCYLDPNGDAAEWILNHIPKERAEDVIYFNPADKERPFGLNMLEWKTADQRDFLVQEAIQIFYKLFDPNQTGMVGPQFEHWMRNASLTLMAHPDGGTIIDIPRLFTDPDFEKDRVKYVTDPVVKSFWEKQMAKTADFHKSEMLNYFTSKFGRFMTNDMMRNILGQTKSSFDFRDIMDNKKILICNLSKGMIGEINAFLLGMVIVSKIAMGAFSRQDMLESERIPFFLYVDEFQNFITDVFATILSESRKYKLGLAITNQYIEQLDEKIRAAVVGNAGTLIAFRMGAADAEFFVKEFDPMKADDLTSIDKYNFYIKELIDGAPSRPFNGQSIWPDDYDGNPELGKAIKELSRLKYGKPKEIVEAEILERSKVDVIDLPGLNANPAAGLSTK